MCATLFLLACSAIGAGVLIGARQNTPTPTPASAQLPPVTARPANDTRLADEQEKQFQALDVFVDSGAKPLGAYQFEFGAPTDVSIIGIEGGDAADFKNAPYYDPAALQQNRLLVAAIAQQGENDDRVLARKAAGGMQRVARLHLYMPKANQMTLEKMVATMIAAGDDQAERIDPLPRIELRSAPPSAAAPVPPSKPGASP